MVLEKPMRTIEWVKSISLVKRVEALEKGGFLVPQVLSSWHEAVGKEFLTPETSELVRSPTWMRLQWKMRW
ncbi:hypothetical protein ABZP36_000187 [Zizania latifolia]